MSDEATRTQPRRSLEGTVLSGRYRLESKLGSGGMSTVYLAKDQTLERWVAVKVLHQEISDQPDQIERFRREARAVAQLSHPNVVNVIDAGEDGGYPYIVFEYVEGQTLKSRIEEAGQLPLDEAVAYAIEIGRGLAAAHARMLVHRDVKPQNVLIDADGRAKVTDFGIARSLESDGLTKTGRVLGTTDYVSPEQAMGQEVDARSDIYSLGILLFEMVTGRVPFTAETLVGVAMKHVNEPLPRVQALRPGASAALAGVIEKATAKDPRKRYADMASMVADLEAVLEVEMMRAGRATEEATSVLESVPGRRFLTSRRLSIAGILIVLAATAAALLIAGLTGKRTHGGGGAATPSGTPIRLASAQAFDPEGSPPGEENNSEAPLAINGDPADGWSTEHYDATPVIEDSVGKPGVGLIVSAAQPAVARTMTILSPVGGWTADVYGSAAASPPGALSGWGQPIGHVADAATSQTVELSATAPYRHFLIWITKLAPSADSPGRFSVEIDEVKLAS